MEMRVNRTFPSTEELLQMMARLLFVLVLSSERNVAFAFPENTSAMWTEINRSRLSVETGPECQTLLKTFLVICFCEVFHDVVMTQLSVGIAFGTFLV